MVCGKGGLSGLCIGGRTFGGLGLQDHSNVSLVSNIFEGSFIEEVKLSGKSIFEVGFKLAASEERNKLDSTASK